jgi:hypothetical protein
MPARVCRVPLARFVKRLPGLFCGEPCQTSVKNGFCREAAVFPGDWEPLAQEGAENRSTPALRAASPPTFHRLPLGPRGRAAACPWLMGARDWRRPTGAVERKQRRGSAEEEHRGGRRGVVVAAGSARPRPFAQIRPTVRNRMLGSLRGGGGELGNLKP